MVSKYASKNALIFIISLKQKTKLYLSMEKGRKERIALISLEVTYAEFCVSNFS